MNFAEQERYFAVAGIVSALGEWGAPTPVSIVLASAAPS